MRVRPTLIFWCILNLWLGISLVLAPSHLSAAARTVLALVIDYSFGGAFLLAALLCLVAALLWSRWMQQRVAIHLIRLGRMAALGASLSVMLALTSVEIVLVIADGGMLLSVGIVAGLAWMQALSISEADLTPEREAYIWQPVQGRGKKRWTLQSWSTLFRRLPP
jgi:hypothetical protein